jgi:hypothetical protein
MDSKKKRSQNYVHLTGGLGNQLFQLAAALSMGCESINLVTVFGKPRSNAQGIPDILFFQLPLGVNQTSSAKLKIFTGKVIGYLLRTNVENLHTRFTSKISKTIALPVISYSLNRIMRIFVCNGIGFSGFIPKSKLPTFIVGYFQCETYLRHSNVLKKMSSLTPSTHVKEIKVFRLKSIRDKPLIVHVRLGDYKNEESFGILGEEYYRKGINSLMTTGSFGRIWLFSDEPDIAIELIPPEFRALTDIINEESFPPGAILEVMRYGKGYVIANSSFSWWGAILSHSKNPPVVVPSPWFSKLGTPNQLIPRDWIQVAAHEADYLDR